MANELSLWTHKNAILPAASTLVSVAESNPDTFSHRYCLPDVISFPVRFRLPAIPQFVSLFSGAACQAQRLCPSFFECSPVCSVRFWIFRASSQAWRQQRPNARTGLGRRRRYFLRSGVPPVLCPNTQFGLGRHHSEYIGCGGGLPPVWSMGRNVVDAPVRVGKQGRDLVVLATGQYLPPGLSWYFHHPIDSLTERYSLEQLGHRCSHVCWERWDSAARVERADRKAPSVEPGSLGRVGAEAHVRRTRARHGNRPAGFLRAHWGASLRRPNEISSRTNLDIVLAAARFKNARPERQFLAHHEGSGDKIGAGIEENESICRESHLHASGCRRSGSTHPLHFAGVRTSRPLASTGRCRSGVLLPESPFDASVHAGVACAKRLSPRADSRHAYFL